MRLKHKETERAGQDASKTETVAVWRSQFTEDV